MINHYQTDIAGDTYRRAKSVILNNPKGGTKSVSYALEDIINLKDGKFVSTDAPTLVGNIDSEDLSQTITLYHPTTNQVVGQAKLGDLSNQIFVALHSYMIYLEEKQNDYTPTA